MPAGAVPGSVPALPGLTVPHGPGAAGRPHESSLTFLVFGRHVGGGLRAGARASTGAPTHPALLSWVPTVVRPLRCFSGKGPLSGLPVRADRAAALPLSDGPPDRRRLYGCMAAMFFAGAGMLGLITLPLPAPGSERTATAVVYAVALALGVAIWFAPWEL